MFPDSLRAHLQGDSPAVAPEPIVAILDLEDGVVTLDELELVKQPDWSYEKADSGKWPAARLDDHRMPDESL